MALCSLYARKVERRLLRYNAVAPEQDSVKAMQWGDGGGGGGGGGECWVLECGHSAWVVTTGSHQASSYSVGNASMSRASLVPAPGGAHTGAVSSVHSASTLA